jgi:hypothetical protein
VNWFLLLISSLAIFRLSELVSLDNGPFHIFKKLRAVCPKTTKFGELIGCFYCNSMWYSIIVCTVYALARVIPWSMYPIWVFGIAGGAVVFYRSIRPRE